MEDNNDHDEEEFTTPDWDEISDLMNAHELSETLEPNPETLTQSQSIINRMNQNHAVVMVGGKCSILNEIIDPISGMPDISLSTLTDFKNRYANKKISHPENPKKSITYAELWWNAHDRREFQGIIFDPPSMTQSGMGTSNYYNLWRGFTCNPVQGDWSLFQNHIFNILANRDEELYWWIIAWMARIVKDPGGQRPGTSLVLRGRQGTGKGVFVDNFGKLFGKHYLKIAQPSQITGRFNQHLKDALLVFVDEGFWAGDKQAEGILKSMVTEETINIEPKGIDLFSVKNNMNIIIASNNDWVVPAGLEERRFLVTDVSEEKMQDHSYFSALAHQMENGGREAMMHDLLYWNLPKINLREIRRTTALFEQIINSMNTIQRFWYEKLQNGTLSDLDNDWVGQIPFGTLYQDYLHFAKSINDRHPVTKQQFGIQLRKLCKNIRERKTNNNGKRSIEKIFPPLDQCRKEFEKLVRMEGQIEWEDNGPADPNQYPPTVYV